MSGGKQVKMLDERIAELEEQKRMLDERIAELKQMRGKMRGENAPVAKARAQRSSVKALVIELLEQAGADGLNASEAVDKALMEKGQQLERGTVSSLLSRLKGEGIAHYDNVKYRLKKFAPQPEDRPNVAHETPGVVRPLRASGQ